MSNLEDNISQIIGPLLFRNGLPIDFSDNGKAQYMNAAFDQLPSVSKWAEENNIAFPVTPENAPTLMPAFLSFVKENRIKYILVIKSEEE